MPQDKHYYKAKHKAWRAKVLRNAKYLCQECSRYGLRVPGTIAHHLLPIEEYPERKYDVSNGVALCQKCHNRAHPEKLRGGMENR